MRRLSCSFMRGIAPHVLGSVWRASTQQSFVGDVQPKYYDPSTWPKDWTADNIEEFLHSNISTSVTKLNYETLAMLLSVGDISTLTSLLRMYCKVPEIDAIEYLAKHLDTDAGPAMQLQERGKQISDLDSAVTVPRGTARRLVVFSNSIRGSGKTEFLKSFALTRRLEALKCGRLIVRCCIKAQRGSKGEPTWIDRVLEDSKTNTTSKAVNATEEGLCELIKTHVESVTGFPQDARKYSDPASAYESWIRETKTRFKISDDHNMDPLILIDNCEILAQQDHKSLGNKHEDRSFTLLEAFSLAVPAPYCIFVIGSVATMSSLIPLEDITVRAIQNIGPLLPLSYLGSATAITESWNKEADENLREPLFHLSGGLPRPLRLALAQEPQGVSFGRGSAKAFARCFEAYKDAVKRASGDAHKNSLTHAYTCLLASSTKASVHGGENIPINPSWNAPPPVAWTYNDAMLHSIGFYDKHSKRFIVPPIAVVDEIVPTPTTPILPSELHPFLITDVVRKFAPSLNLARQRRLFERAFFYAVYARYLLVFWRTMNPWVPLNEVFDGAIRPEQVKLINRFEVNLSGGVHEATSKRQKQNQQNKVTYEDWDDMLEANLWCRTAARPSAEFAVPLLYGHNVARFAEFKHPKGVPKLRVSRKSNAPLSEVVDVNASAMSSVTWLYP